jgi:hypothetical protein
MKKLFLFFIVIMIIFFAGCIQNSNILQQTKTQTIASPDAQCHIINDSLPDPNCTPGIINPLVTQNNINSTICESGFTSSIRPPISYTEPLKVQSIQQYGYYDTNPSDYEYDHLIPLEIGGSPTDVKNLWAEPSYTTFNYHIKDRFENYLNKQVCSGALNLSEAQYEIATNWVYYWQKAGEP